MREVYYAGSRDLEERHGFAGALRTFAGESEGT